MPKPLTPVKRRIVEAAVKIRGDEPIDQLSFLHSILCTVGMPRKAIDERRFDRVNGAAMLRIEAGALYNGRELIDQPLPYGVKPRLIMVHVSSEAVRQNRRDIEIGRSAHQFLERLDLDTNSRSYAMTKKQIMALAACRMTLGFMAGGVARTINTEPFEKFDAWLQREDTGQMTMWPGVIELSQKFYDTLREHAVPLDPEALKALKHSALALDIYSWLAHRLCRLQRPTRLSNDNLKDQFGQEYREEREAMRAFNLALRQVLIVYPDARIESVRGGLILKPSPPPVARLVLQGVDKSGEKTVEKPSYPRVITPRIPRAIAPQSSPKDRKKFMQSPHDPLKESLTY